MLVPLIASMLLISCQKGSNSVPLEELGANLEGISDWSRSFAFADVMKQSREFGKPDKPWEKITDLDANGWPTTDFGVILFVDLKGVKNTGGDYHFSFSSKGNPSIKAVASSAEVTLLHQHNGNFDGTLSVPVNAGELMLSFTNTNGGVKNLKIMRPLPAEGEFCKMFVDHVRRFGTLRFMDWGNTNGNKLTQWSQRSTPLTPSYSGGKGVSYESMIDLANLAKSDAWICVPAHADVNYIKSLAKLCKSRLSPSAKLYIENSNEVWNWGFEQAQFNLQQAKAEGPNAKDLNWDGTTGEWTWPARRVAKRLMQIRGIFAEVYGSSFKTTVRPVLAAQIVWPENWMEQGLNYIERNYGPPKDYIYAIAGAPYFNVESIKDKKVATKEEILDALEKSVDTMDTWAKGNWYRAVIKKYNLKFLAYEAGPDTFGPNSIEAKRDAQFDPRMKSIMLKYYRKWREIGGGLMNYFVAGATNYDSQYGTWGLTNDLTKVTPKIQAIDEILAGRWKN